MALLETDGKAAVRKQNGARLVVIASLLSTGVFGSSVVGAAGMEGGAWVSLEGLDGSAAFVTFDTVGEEGRAVSAVQNSLGSQDLSVLLAEVENVLGDGAAPDAVQVKAFVAEAQALAAPIIGAMGGGTVPDLATNLSLENVPLSGFGAGGGGAPLALPGLDGLGALVPLDGLGDPLGVTSGLGNGLGSGLNVGLPVGGAVDGALGGVTDGLGSVPVVGGLLGQ